MEIMNLYNEDKLDSVYLPGLGYEKENISFDKALWFSSLNSTIEKLWDLTDEELTSLEEAQFLNQISYSIVSDYTHQSAQSKVHLTYLDTGLFYEFPAIIDEQLGSWHNDSSGCKFQPEGEEYEAWLRCMGYMNNTVNNPR